MAIRTRIGKTDLMFANVHNAEVPHIILAWYLTRETIDVVIPGAKRSSQVVHNLKTLDVHLSEEEIQTIDRIFRQ